MIEFIYEYSMIVFLYSIFSYLWNYNIKRSKSNYLITRIELEKPLDDIVHYIYDNSQLKCNQIHLHKICDICAVVLPICIFIPNYNDIILYNFFIELGIFHVYKQIICIVTRLPPTLKQNLLSRKMMGFTIGTPIDYGISGHTSIPILLFFHIRTYYSFLAALLQCTISLISKDHYTIDIIHTWVFIFAIYNKMTYLY